MAKNTQSPLTPREQEAIDNVLRDPLTFFEALEDLEILDNVWKTTQVGFEVEGTAYEFVFDSCDNLNSAYLLSSSGEAFRLLSDRRIESLICQLLTQSSDSSGTQS